MSITSALIREMFAHSDKQRNLGLSTPSDILRYDDIPYGPDAQWQILDVYRLRTAGEARLPVIVSVHGGGWVYGDKTSYQFYCMDLARRGFAVVNFTYRLAPESKFPAQMEDTHLVFRWTLDNAETYGFDPTNIFAVGDSCGAQLLGLYTAFCTNPAYAAEYPFTPLPNFSPKAIALNCGAYRVEDSQTNLLRRLTADLLPEKGSPKELNSLDVTAHITADYPPVFFMTSSGDFARKQAPLLEQALSMHGVPYEFHDYGDEQNKLPHVFHCDVKSEDARICNDAECAFFRSL